MKLVKQIGYKLIVTMCIVMTFCCFIASTPVEASKVNTSDFYYSGTVKGTYTVNKGFVEKLVDSLGEILDYLLGIMTMGIRIVFVGWTALLERCLTWILEGATGENVEIDKVSSTNITGSDDYITLDAIFFNRVPLLDINVFDFEIRDDVTATGMEKDDEETTTTQGEDDTHEAPMIVYVTSNNEENTIMQGEKNEFKASTTAIEGEEDEAAAVTTDTEEDDDDSLIMILKKAIAGWYYTFRLISIMVMLVLLVYIGVKLAIQSAASEKALYKRVLVDWLVGMILVFSIHYIMIAIIQFNEVLVEQISTLRQGATGLEVYEYGLIQRAQEPVSNEELEMTLYEEVKTRAYDAKLTVGTTGMIMYMVLVYYAWKYTFIYLKRYLTVAVLVMIAPLIAVSYAFNKVNSGKSQIFSKWLKEFFFMVILQSVHALIYVIFVDTALQLSLSSVSGMVLVFMLLNFMCKAEGIFRKIFNIKGDLADEGGIKEAIGNLKNGMLAMGAGKLAKKYSKGIARLTTKPLRMAGGATFGKIMEKRANSQKYKDKVEGFKAESAERIRTIRQASILKSIQSKDIDINKLEQAVESLKDSKGEVITDQDGAAILVDDAYIKKEQEALQEIKNINNLSDDTKTDIMNKYNKMTTKGALASHYIKGKWREIMDPYQYVKEVEKGKYKARKTQREYQGKYIGLGKKTDGVGKHFAEHIKLDKLLGLDKNTKANLKQQAELAKNQIFAFMGILAGLPMLVAEPKLGAAFLYQGVISTHNAYGFSGQRKKKDLRKLRMMPDGKYTLVGFEGNSQNTIANEAKRQARLQIEEIYLGKAIQDDKMKNRVKEKHPKLYAKLNGPIKIGGVAAVTIGTTVLTPVSLPISALAAVTGVVTGVAASGGRGNLGSNAWGALHETVKAARRANAKLFEQQEKSTDAYLASLAGNYFEMEADQQAAEAKRHSEEFLAAFAAVKAAEEKNIDEMEITQVQRELEYEEIEIETKDDGTRQLSGSSENTIIDNAIIDVAEKCDITDINEFDLSDSHISQVTKEITSKCRQLGLEKDAIQDLDKKVKNRQAILAKDGSKAVENRIVDKAIVKAMKKKGEKVTDPNQVSEEDIISALNGETSDGSKKVLENIQAAKPTDGSKTFNSSNDGSRAVASGEQARMSQVITARKAVIANKSKSAVDEQRAQQMKELLKRKKNLELDTAVLQQQASIETGEPLDTIEENAVSQTDAVLQLLQVQTKLHQDKQNYERIVTSSSSKKLKEYKAELFDDRTNIRRDVLDEVNQYIKDKKENKRVGMQKEAEINRKYASMGIDELLITSYNNQK